LVLSSSHNITCARDTLTIAVNISLTLIGNCFTHIVLGITLVSLLAVSIRVTATLVIILADWSRVDTVVVSGAAWTTSKTITVSTVETVAVGHVTDSVKSITLTILHTCGLTSVGVSVTEVTCFTVSISVTATFVVTLADWSGVHTVVIGSATWAASLALTISTVEAVVIGIITHSIISITLRIILTLLNTHVVIIVTVVTSLTVIISVTATQVGAHVTHWCWIGTIDVTVMTTLTASIRTATVSTTEEAVVMVSITHFIISLTVGVILTDTGHTYMAVRVTLITIGTVIIVNTTCCTFMVRATISTRVRIMRSWNIANTIKIVTIRVVLAITVRIRIDTFKVKRTITVRALGTIRVFTAFAIFTYIIVAINIARPVTDRSFWILISDIK